MSASSKTVVKQYAVSAAASTSIATTASTANTAYAASAASSACAATASDPELLKTSKDTKYYNNTKATLSRIQNGCLVINLEDGHYKIPVHEGDTYEPPIFRFNFAEVVSNEQLVKLKLTGVCHFSLAYKGLEGNTTITHLDLTSVFCIHSTSNISPRMDEITEIVRSNGTLTTLILDKNRLGNEGLVKLASAFTPNSNGRFNTSLKHLSLSSIHALGVSRVPGGAAAVYEYITEASINTFVSSIAAHPSLVSLNFRNNTVAGNDIMPFARLLSSADSQLKQLNLESSHIRSASMTAIGQALCTNVTLTSINVKDLKIEVMSLQPFVNVFRLNRTLTSLTMRAPDMSMYDKTLLTDLAEALTQNKTLHHFKIQKMRDSERKNLIPFFKTVLAQNKTLLELGEDSSINPVAAIDITERTAALPSDSAMERTRLLTRNKRLQITHKVNVSRVAILTAFIRANSENAIKYSVRPLVPNIINQVGDPNDNYDLNPKQKFKNPETNNNNTATNTLT